MEQLLDRARSRGLSAELYRRTTLETVIEYTDNQLKEIRNSENSGATLRVINKAGLMGISTTTKPNDLERLLEHAVTTSDFGSQAGFDFPGMSPLPAPKIADLSLVELPIDRMVNIVTDLAAAVQAEDPQIQAGAQITRSISTIGLKNTSGFDAEYNHTAFVAALIADLTEGSNMIAVFDFAVGTHFDFDAEKLKDKVLGDFRVARVNVPMPPGEYPVIVSPRAMLDLLRPVLACLEGKAVVKGISPWKGRLGERMFSEAFTLYDDGAADGCVNSGVFDGEGVPMQRKALIDRGVPSHYLLDLQSAAKLGMKPTGNGMRVRDNTPAPSMTNLVAPAGEHDLNAMIGGISSGLLVDSLMGAWAGNPYTGQISGNINLGYKIENGRRVGRVKDTMFATNVFEAFRERFLGCSRELVRTQFGVLPYFMFDRANISSKE